MSDVVVKVETVGGPSIKAESVGGPSVGVGDQSVIKGEDGFSPVVSFEQIEDGYKLTIVDANGTHEANILNGAPGQDGDTGPQGIPGADGQDGSDGFSPTVSVSEITGGHRITITDATGDHSADVMDGKNGADGQDGTSPAVTFGVISGGHTMTVTDKTHPTGQTINIMDGVQGPQGIQGEKGDKGDKGDTGETGTQGPKGDTGDTGPKGDTGATGPQGPKGDTGEQGPKGDKGDKGDTGATGPQGPQGPADTESVKVVAQTLTDSQKAQARRNINAADESIYTDDGVNIGSGGVNNTVDSIVLRNASAISPATSDLDAEQSVLINPVIAKDGYGQLQLGAISTPGAGYIRVCPWIEDYLTEVGGVRRIYSETRGPNAVAIGPSKAVAKQGNNYLPALAFGNGCVASGAYSTAIGQYNFTQNLYGISAGVLLTNTAYAKTVVGSANIDLSDSIFEVGNGYITTSQRGNAFRVTTNGKAIAQNALGIEDGQGSVVEVSAAQLETLKAVPTTYRTAAAQDVIDAGKAPLASPSLTGTPTAPTAAQGANSQQIATTAYADAALSNFAYVNSGDTADKAYAANELLVYKGQLYKASAAIAIGETLTPDSNITLRTIATALKNMHLKYTSIFNGGITEYTNYTLSDSLANYDIVIAEIYTQNNERKAYFLMPILNKIYDVSWNATDSVSWYIICTIQFTANTTLNVLKCSKRGFSQSNLQIYGIRIV